MMSSILAKLTATTVSRAAARNIACYSTEVPAGAKFDVSSFIGRIDALHAAQAKKGQDKRTGLKFSVNRPEKNATPQRRAEGVKGDRPFNNEGRRFNKNGNNRNYNGPRKSNFNNNNNTNYHNNNNNNNNSNDRNAYMAKSSGPAKPTKNLARFSNMEIDSALADSSNEKVDLHVASSGGVLFDNSTRRTASSSRSQRGAGYRNPGQRFGNANNNNNPTKRTGSARFGAKKGSPRVQRKNADAKQPRRPVSIKMTPEQALQAVHRRLSHRGSTISIGALTNSTLTPYIPGLCHTPESRILRAIQQVPASGQYSEAELKAIVESTCKGSLVGFKIPESTKAHGQESIIPVLNNNMSYSPELKNLFLKLASGETPISSLRK